MKEKIIVWFSLILVSFLLSCVKQDTANPNAKLTNTLKLMQQTCTNNLDIKYIAYRADITPDELCTLAFSPPKLLPPCSSATTGERCRP